MFKCIRNCQNNLPNWLYHFSFLPPMYESFSCLSSSPLLLVMPDLSFKFQSISWVCSNNLYLFIISLKIDNVEHLLMSIFVISVSSLVKYLFKHFDNFWNCVIYFLIINIWAFLYTLYPSPFSDICTMNIFYHS